MGRVIRRARDPCWYLEIPESVMCLWDEHLSEAMSGVSGWSSWQGGALWAGSGGLCSMLEGWVDRGLILVLTGFRSVPVLVNPEGVTDSASPICACVTCVLCGAGANSHVSVTCVSLSTCLCVTAAQHQGWLSLQTAKGQLSPQPGQKPWLQAPGWDGSAHTGGSWATVAEAAAAFHGA